MSRHATAEVLSAYLDDELSAAEHERLAGHLESCDDCRAHLKSMRRVVTSVRRLERMAPPPVLAGDVERHIALSGRPASPMEWMEERLGRIHSASSILFMFALITALAVISYFFAHGVERAQQPRTALVLNAPELPPLDGRVRATREVEGRTFDLVNRIWRERGIPIDLVDVPVQADGEVGRRLLDAYPGLAELGPRIRLLVDGQVVELRGLDPYWPSDAEATEEAEAENPGLSAESDFE